MRKLKWIGVSALLVAAFILSGCSPEATRKQGGGPGADIGNNRGALEIHGKTDPGYQTPNTGRGIEVQRNAGK